MNMPNINIKNPFKYATREAKIILATASTIFLMLFIISIIILVTAEKNPVSITNFSEEISAPNDYKKGIENTIWNALKSKRSDIEKSSLSDLKIRNNSISEETLNDNTTTTFLVDLDSLKYTFKISFYWNKNSKTAFSDPSINIYCPTPEENNLYKTPCIIEDETTQLKRHLPIEIPLTNNTKINLTIKHPESYESTNSEYLSAEIPSCTKSSTLEDAKKIIETWLKSIYLDPKNIQTEISCTHCTLNSKPTGKNQCFLSKTGDTSLLGELPHAEENFKIEPSNNSKYKIKITIFLARSSKYYPKKTDEAKKLYEKEALNWITSRGYKVSDYPYETTLELY